MGKERGPVKMGGGRAMVKGMRMGTKKKEKGGRCGPEQSGQKGGWGPYADLDKCCG